ncbi:hypothetical protein NL676_032357 [Syzygium grande]|nr:hypothetical protein NL676_032357 [Syzygium grande]
MSNPQMKRNFQIEAFKHKEVVDPKHAYNMVLHKFGEKLYSGLATTMTAHLEEISKSIEDAQGGYSVCREESEQPFPDVSAEFVPFLEVSALFYKGVSQKFIECCDSGEYLKEAERRRNEEMERVTHSLDAKSEVKITNAVEKEMTANNMLTLVHMENSGLMSMLCDGKEIGKQLITDPEMLKDPVEFVQWLLDEKDKYDKIISSACNNDQTFQNALNSSFEYLINLNARSPEFISLYVDNKLRKGLEGIGKEDVEVILDKVVMLLRYLREKDVFEKYYEQHLAERLPSGKTVSDGAERSLIAKLKIECGCQFTSIAVALSSSHNCHHWTLSISDLRLRRQPAPHASLGDMLTRLRILIIIVKPRRQEIHCDGHLLDQQFPDPCSDMDPQARLIDLQSANVVHHAHLRICFCLAADDPLQEDGFCSKNLPMAFHCCHGCSVSVAPVRLSFPSMVKHKFRPVPKRRQRYDTVPGSSSKSRNWVWFSHLAFAGISARRLPFSGRDRRVSGRVNMSDPQKKRNFQFQIEAFKHKEVVDPKYADKTWKILEHAIHEIYNDNASSICFEDLYRHAYNMVMHGFGEKLYSGLATTMTAHLEEMSKSIEDAQGGLFLEELNRKWNDHIKALKMIGDILMYMHRTFIPITRKAPVHELGLILWRDNVIYSSKIRTRLLDTLLELVLTERTGVVINRGLMRNITKMLMDLGYSVCREESEQPFPDVSAEFVPFLEVSALFYKGESQKFIECCDSGEYLKEAERRRNEEMERVTHSLDAKSEVEIKNAVEKEMMANNMLTLVHMENSGLVGMLCGGKYEDLGRMYNLFRRVPNGLSTVRDVMTSHIREIGKQLITDPERLKDPVEFVQWLLDEKDKYDKIISSAFNNDQTFQNALNSSFEYLINLNARSPEFISLYVDNKLRKGLEGVGKDMEVILDKVVMLLRYLREKDVFEKYYEQHLAERLLSGKTVSDGAERSLIAKLKTECGCQFTSMYGLDGSQ